MAEAMFDYAPQHAGDLALKVGDKVQVLRKGEDGWWSGTLRGQQGNFPGGDISVLPTVSLFHMSPVVSSVRCFLLYLSEPSRLVASCVIMLVHIEASVDALVSFSRCPQHGLGVFQSLFTTWKRRKRKRLRFVSVRIFGARGFSYFLDVPRLFLADA